MKYKIKYDGNESETYTLIVNNKPQLEIDVNEDQMIGIIKDIQDYLDSIHTTWKETEYIAQLTKHEESIIINIWVGNQIVEGNNFNFKDY